MTPVSHGGEDQELRDRLIRLETHRENDKENAEKEEARRVASGEKQGHRIGELETRIGEVVKEFQGKLDLRDKEIAELKEKLAREEGREEVRDLVAREAANDAKTKALQADDKAERTGKLTKTVAGGGAGLLLWQLVEAIVALVRHFGG